MNNTDAKRALPAPTCCGAVERAKRKWWTITDDNKVQEVTGYSCAPHNPESWWCPEVGCTLHEKHHLWDNEQAALGRAIEKIKRSIQVQVEALQALVVRQHNRGISQNPQRKD